MSGLNLSMMQLLNQFFLYVDAILTFDKQYDVKTMDQIATIYKWKGTTEFQN